MPPNLVFLVGVSNRSHAITVIEGYLQAYVDWEERLDPGGLAQEQQLELMDRGCTEKKLKRERKRERQGQYCVVQ